MLKTRNRERNQSRCLVYEISFTEIFNVINHGYRAAISKENSSWLLPFYMAVATYFYYEEVHRTMRSVIVTSLIENSIIHIKHKRSFCLRISFFTSRIIEFSEQYHVSHRF